MLIDAPGIDDKKKAGETTIELTDDNADEVLAMINRLNR
jgi:hypothetical protein